MSYKIITISRESGSAGRTIGKMVAEKFNIPCYDAEIIEKMAEESGFALDYVKKEGENVGSGFLATLFTDRSAGPTNQDKLWAIQREIILDLAAKGPCVIVGRCSDYILKDRDDVLSVFIHSPFEKRVARICEKYGKKKEEVDVTLKDKDKRRAAYHRFYTDMKWGHSQNYDICLNSADLGIDKCAEILEILYK